MAADELEQMAVKYATEAVQLDRHGSVGMAIARYQRAVEVLLKLCSLYPNAPQTHIYMQHVGLYQKRIKELQGLQKMEQQPATGETPPVRFEHLVVTEKPNVKWTDVANLEFAKRAIQESIIYPVRRPDRFPLGWPRGILLFGPPGCGKTLLAAAVATEVNGVFYCVDAASIMSKWLGESEKNVARLFEDARMSSDNGQPAIIFMDEIDSLVGVRTDEVGGEVRTRNQFLKEMDNVVDKSKKLHVYVIGATNKPWVLDEPFIRRFQKRIFVPLPDANARLEMFKLYARNLQLASDVDFNVLVQLSEGYSGSDIRDIYQAVQIKVVREFFESNSADNPQLKPRMITMQDFRDVIAERKPSVSQALLSGYVKWFQEFEAL